MLEGVLVSAVFEAFLNIYRNRIKDLLRIATGGTGVLPQGELHPDLVNRLAIEASKAAGHVLNMCIRALDYCPPVDITFGDYLRAIITADAALVSNDDRDFRLSFIEAFRRRGIYPQGIKTFSVESLGLGLGNFISPTTKGLFAIIVKFLREYRDEVIYQTNRTNIYTISKKYIGGAVYNKKTKILGLHSRIMFKFDDSIEFEQLTGFIFNNQWQGLGVRTSTSFMNNISGPSFQIQNLRVVSRVGPQGNQINQIVFSLVQRSGVEMDNGIFKRHFTPESVPNLKSNQFYLYGGCTMIFDLDTLELKNVVTKPLLNIAALKTGMRKIDTERAERQYLYQNEEGLMHMNEFDQYFGNGLHNNLNEPFSFLHH